MAAIGGLHGQDNSHELRVMLAAQEERSTPMPDLTCCGEPMQAPPQGLVATAYCARCERETPASGMSVAVATRVVVQIDVFVDHPGLHRYDLATGAVECLH